MAATSASSALACPAPSRSPAARRTVTNGARCGLAAQYRLVLGSVLETFGNEIDAHVRGRARAAAPEFIASIVDLHGSVAVLDESRHYKQPDWTFVTRWSGKSPAERTASAVNGLSSSFMLDAATYRVGADAGFNGMDFYAVGRAGVVGDVTAEHVTACPVFFSPEVVRNAWEGEAGADVPTLWDEAEALTNRAADRDYAVLDDAEVPFDRLLVYEVGSGWEPLCLFLGVDVPAGDFPRSNSTEELQAMVAPPDE